MNVYYPPSAFIKGSGVAFGANKVSNADLVSGYQCDPAVLNLTTKLNIHSRYFANDEQSLSDLATKAAIDALNDAGLDINKIDRIILATTTADYLSPASAAVVQNKLGARDIPCFDVNAACSGFLCALDVGLRFLHTGDENILIIGADVRSRTLNFNDVSTVGIYGDGAGALVISKNPAAYKITSSLSFTNTRYPEAITIGSVGKLANGEKPPAVINMAQGPVIMRYAIKAAKSVFDAMENNHSISREDLSCIIFHQPNPALLNVIAKSCNLLPRQFHNSCSTYGNTVSASIPVTFHLAKQAGEVSMSEPSALVSIGAGMAAYGVLING